MKKLMSPIRKKKKKLSSLEAEFVKQAEKRLLPFQFEAQSFPYIIESHYNPDFKIGKNVFIETKGHFDKQDRRKMRAFTKQYPKVKVYMLFGNSDNKISKKSKTTYGEWCRKNGIPFADIRKGFPSKWWPKRKGFSIENLISGH